MKKPTNIIGNQNSLSRRRFITKFHRILGETAVECLREFQIATEFPEEKGQKEADLPKIDAEKEAPHPQYSRPTVPRI